MTNTRPSRDSIALRSISTGALPVGRHSVLIMALACVIAGSVARAEQPGFYSGGKFHPLIVSQTERVVEFTDSQQRTAAAVRMRSSGATLSDLPWGEQGGRFALLTLPEDAAARLRTKEIPGVQAVHRVYRCAPGDLPIVGSGKVVVKLKPNLAADDRTAMWSDYRVEEVGKVDGVANAFVVRPAGDSSAYELDTANALHHDPRVAYAHPDLRMPVKPHDETFLDLQWHLDNIGQGDGFAGEDINISAAWLRTFGVGVIVGQFDDSCDVNHEDLEANYSGVSHDAETNVRSALAAVPKGAGERHGTAAMGVIVAAINDLGVVGVAPAATFTASRGLQASLTASQIASAYNFARDSNVDVHNNSWGLAEGTPLPDVLVDAVETAYREGRDGLGMVLVFAAGNGGGMNPDDAPGHETFEGDELSTLPTVIGVGSCNARGERVAYSNFGSSIDILAPSNDYSDPDLSLPAIVTTDNTDSVFGKTEPGYNNAGFSDDGTANLADPNYTMNFGGTSASAAQVSGAATLVLALQHEYTAMQVRNILEHNCDKIETDVANYNPVTSRSKTHGYGRLNVGRAVEATFDGYVWPERAANVCVGSNCNPPTEDNTIQWKINDDLRTLLASTNGVPTISVLVVESDNVINWAPRDGTTYSVNQQVASGVFVRANLLAEQYTFTPGNGTKHFGIFSVAQTARRGLTYGFGVDVDSAGTVIDSGTFIEPTTVTPPPVSQTPRVTISVSPLSGDSPLTVTFTGNAQSTRPIDSFVWDFGDGTTAAVRNTTHVYTVATGTQRFFPKLTATDIDGNIGERSVAVDVTAPGGDNGGGSEAAVHIRIAVPDSPQSDIASGDAPLAVVLYAEMTGLSTTPTDLSVNWDLGDGNSGQGLSVAHTYRVPGSFPITVTADLGDENNTTLQSTRFLLVNPNAATPTPTPAPTPTPPPSNGGCGAGSMLAVCSMAMLALARRCVR